jgi:hypothetical protein
MPRPERARREKRYQPKTEEEVIKERLYGELAAPEDLEKGEELEKEKKGSNWYLWLCSLAEEHFVKKEKERYKAPPEATEKPKRELPKEYLEAFHFLGWEVNPEAAMAAPKVAGLFGVVIGMVILILVVLTLGFDGFMVFFFKYLIFAVLLFSLPILVPVILIMYTQKYPMNAADREKLRALTYVPEMINYLIMEMRLQPNLERAVEFASEHGTGRIADEFKEVLWRNRVGIYESIEEGLDELAYKWEPYSEEFKHSITMIRASVLIPDDVERNILYDSIIDDILDSTKEKMEGYAASMKQPSMYLFYLAVLLPLMMIIMMPVAAAFANLPVASAPVLIILCTILIPLGTLVYARSVLSKRPAGYTPPDIPDDYPGLPKKGTAIIKGVQIPIVATAIIVGILIVGLGFVAEASSRLSPEKIHEAEVFTGKTPQQPHMLQFFIPMAIAAPLGLYLYAKNVHKRKAQSKIMKMEKDFKDAMYLLASRLGEKKPLEDAISYVKKFMPESKVATELLDNVQRNIMVMGLTLKSAIFDPVYGAMRYVPSRLMTSAFKIMTDSIELGPEVASTSLISVSNQIRNIQKIDELMRKFLDDITSMMRSMATFISPIVLGVVASLQTVIGNIVGSLGTLSGAGEATGAAGEEMASAASRMGGGGLLQVGTVDMAEPHIFQLIIGIYVIELVIILSYFAAKVTEGDNRIAIMVSIGKTLPVAVLVFILALFGGSSIMGGFM